MSLSTYADVSALVRFLMNDAATEVYSDAVLLAPINSAYRNVQRRMATRGCKVFSDVKTLALTAVTGTAISRTSTPALPVDLILPWQLWEKVTGAGDDTYVPMYRN